MYLRIDGQRRYNDSIEWRHYTRGDINVVRSLEGVAKIGGNLDSARKNPVGCSDRRRHWY